MLNVPTYLYIPSRPSSCFLMAAASLMSIVVDSSDVRSVWLEPDFQEFTSCFYLGAYSKVDIRKIEPSFLTSNLF